MRIHVRKTSRSHLSSVIHHPSPLTQRHRNCLAAIRGGTATVGVSLGDIVGEVGKFDAALTEQTALACVGELLAATLARKSALDPNRYVITPKGLEVLEA